MAKPSLLDTQPVHLMQVGKVLELFRERKPILDTFPAIVFVFVFVFRFLVTPINQFLIILGRCTLYTPVCLQDEPTCMRIEPV